MVPTARRVLALSNKAVADRADLPHTLRSRNQHYNEQPIHRTSRASARTLGTKIRDPFTRQDA